MCNKEFEVPNYRGETAKYCSSDCQKIGQSKKVEITCLVCGTKKMVPPSKSEQQFCSLKCLGIWNGERQKNQIEKECIICGNHFNCPPSQENIRITCSIECQAIWQSIYRTGENSSNWRGGNIEYTCFQCGEVFTDQKCMEHRGKKFCSLECKQKYWSTVTIREEEFITKRISGAKLWWEDENNREKMRQLALHRLSIYQKPTKPELAVEEWFKKHDINYFAQHILHNKFCVDFYLPDYNMVVEVYGDYWHANPLIYGEGKKDLNDIQIKNIKMDKARKAYLTKCGYIFEIIWELDINENLNNIMSSLKLFPQDNFNISY